LAAALSFDVVDAFLQAVKPATAKATTSSIVKIKRIFTS
jgi:hypothetical protein